ncbi:hypothetical protein F8M41_012205 [Gigaspora margarita]|uniref:Uncharacterized protein n=1 Tax=Gigaspora margarita TaxID=4874 RepID=A0A8H4ATG7_GIGMA|nr:hypothetical protein F8M41_012205 [Gigaspora margarita]
MEDQKLKFIYIIEQTRKLILRFIRLHPAEWRLLDIRYDLMSVLIEAKEYELVNFILSSKEPLHIPQYISWEGEKNTIHTTFSDRTMLAYFLEYYSNKAVDNDNIGWMNTVVDIIPELCKSNEKKSKKENHKIGWVNTVVDIISKLYKIESKEEKAESYIYYAQKLFYHPCFYEKRLNLISFKFLEISPKANGLLKILIPITQLIPQDCELNLQEIDYNKIVNIRMVPLTDFATNKKIFDKREKNFTDYLNPLISPIQYSSLNDEDYSPFIKLIEKDFKENKHDIRDILYENPLMGAVMNWMWHCSKFYWSRSLYIYALYRTPDISNIGHK